MDHQTDEKLSGEASARRDAMIIDPVLESEIQRELKVPAGAGKQESPAKMAADPHEGCAAGVGSKLGNFSFSGGEDLEKLPLPTEEAGLADGVTYKIFDKESEIAEIVGLIDRDLSEPYSVFTYRYFIYNWPQHTHMAVVDGRYISPPRAPNIPPFMPHTHRPRPYGLTKIPPL